jgi:hypothetical protein
MHRVDVAQLQAMMGNHSQVALRSYTHNKTQAIRRFYLGASLIKRDCYQWCAANMPTNTNPEQWIRKQRRFSTVIYPKTLDKIIIKDLGREWLAQSQYERCSLAEEGFTGYASKGSGQQPNLINQAKLAEQARAKYQYREPSCMTLE